MGRLVTWTRIVIFWVLTFATNSLLDAQNTVPMVDISQDFTRHIVIASGSPSVYQGHPYLVQNPDESLLLVWSVNHGGPAGPIAQSLDKGASWSRIDDRVPRAYQEHRNCPSIYRLVDADGKIWHWVFTSQPFIARIVSGDGGKTWEEKKPLGFSNVMAFSSIVPKNPGIHDGKYLGFYHRRRALDGTLFNEEPPQTGRLEVVVSETTDAGFTWSEPKTIANLPGKDLCEPFAFWSPDHKEICCLLRENTHKGLSMVMFSQDFGKTWSEPSNVAWELTGDRHMGVYVDNERLFIAFRDQAIDSKTKGHFVGWVGKYEDIKNAKPGDYRVKLLHSYAKPWVGDCGYPGVALFKDGTILALTYIKYKDDENKNSIIGTRFSIQELDEIAEKIRLQ